MAQLSELFFQWQISEKLDITFCTQDDTEKPGELLVLVQGVGTVREIVYESKRFKMTCTHTIVPGMIVEAVQMRKVDHISPEAPNQAKRSIAQFLNEYSYAKNGPLKLHFQEEVNERGVPQGHPAMRDLVGQNAQPKKRRASMASALTGGLVKDKKAQEQFEISMSGATARKYSVSGSGQLPVAAQAAARTGRRGSVTAADMTAGPPRSGRRASVVAGSAPMMPPSGRRGSVSSVGSTGPPQSSNAGGRRASISGGEEQAGVVKYLVLEKATVRAGPNSQSPKIGEHKKGAMIDVIQESIDDRGLQVLLTHTAPEGAAQGGWIKLVTSKGKQLLERIGSAETVQATGASRGGRRGSVSSGSMDGYGRRGSLETGGRRGSVDSSGGRRGSMVSTGSGGRRGSLISDDGSFDGGEPLTSSTSFDVKYELHGKNTKFKLTVEPHQIVLNNTKTQSVHAVYRFEKLRTHNYARVVSGGVVIGLPGGTDIYLSTDALQATQISELIHRGKEHADYAIDKAHKKEAKLALKSAKQQQELQQQRQDDDSASSDSDSAMEAVPFDASPKTFRTAFMKYKPGQKVDVESEDGWEYGATVIGPAKSGDSDELRIRFADGVVDDWPVADFRVAKSAEEDGTKDAEEEPNAESKREPEQNLHDSEEDSEEDSESDPESDSGTNASSDFAKAKLKPFPSVDLEPTITEAVDQPDVDPTTPPNVAAEVQNKTEKVPGALVSFLSSCGIDDEAIHEAFVAFGVQTVEDVEELIEEDFNEIGLNTVQKRRVMRSLHGNTPKTTTATVPTPIAEAEPPATVSSKAVVPATTKPEDAPDMVEEAEPPEAAKQEASSMNIYICPFLQGSEVESEILRVKQLIPATVREALFFQVTPDRAKWHAESHVTADH